MGEAIWLYLVLMPAGASESRVAGAHARAKAAARGNFLRWELRRGGSSGCFGAVACMAHVARLRPFLQITRWCRKAPFQTGWDAIGEQVPPPTAVQACPCRGKQSMPITVATPPFSPGAWGLQGNAGENANFSSFAIIDPFFPC